MSSSSEDNTNLVKCAEEICEVFADSVSSLVLMLVALQEKNKPPKPEMQESIAAVAEQANNIGQIAKDLAEEDYEEYPDIQKEIIESAEEVFEGSKNLIKASTSLKSSNLQEGYNQLVDGCRVCGTNCIRLLQIVYGATFKKLAAEQENIRNLAEQLNADLVDGENDQQFADIGGELVSAALQMAEDLKLQAEGEVVPSDKEEMMLIAQNIEEYANELLNAINDFLEDPENEELRIKFEQAKEKLMNEMEKAKMRVAKSHEIVQKQQEALNAQQNAANAAIDDKIANVKPIIPKEEQIETGKKILENLDKSAEAVFWNNPKDFVPAVNENMQEIPKFIDGRIADARQDKNYEKENELQQLKDDFNDFVSKSKLAFADPENDEKKNEAIKMFKKEREQIVKELEQLGLEDIPDCPQVEEATFDFDDDDEQLAKGEEALKKVSKDKIEQLKDNYKRVEAMEYAIDIGDQNKFVVNAKPTISEVQQYAQKTSNEAVKEKNPKKKKVSEKLLEDLNPAINNSKVSVSNPNDKEKKEKAKESLEKLKDDLVDCLVAEGVPKRHAEKVLSEKEKNEEMIKELLDLKQSAVELQNAIEKKNPHQTSNNLRESVGKVKEKVPKMKEDAAKNKEPMLDIYAENINKKAVPLVKACNEYIKDNKSEEKNEECKKAVEEYIAAIDDALKQCNATADEMKVVPKIKIDSEIAKKAEKTKEKAQKVRDDLFDEEMKDLESSLIDFEKAQEEMIKAMKEDAKKSGNKDDEKRVKDFEDEFKDAKEAVEKALKEPKDKEKRQKAEEEMRKYVEKLNDLLDEEGRPVKEKEKALLNVDKDLNKLRAAIENVETDKVKEQTGKLMEDFAEYKKLKEADGEKLDQSIIDAIKEVNASAIAAAREPKNIIKRKKAVEQIKTCRDKLLDKPVKEKTEEKLNQEMIDEIEAIEAEAEKITLNDDEELRILLEDIAKAARRVAEALENENEEELKAALEELEKKMKMKDAIFDKALERMSEKDREIMKRANEKLSQLNKEMVDLGKEALEDGDLKGKAAKAKKISGETSKVVQPMKGLLGKPNEQKADELADAILEDCKLAEKLAKNPNEKLAKELKEKLRKDVERYEKAIKDLLENADLTPEEREELLKKLEEIKKQAKEMEKNLDKLIKDPKDKEAAKALAEAAKKVEEGVKDLNDDFAIKAKAKCKKAQKTLDKCKEAAICKDKESGEQAVAELIEDGEELLKEMNEVIAKEKNAKTKKEMEECKKEIEESLKEAQEATKKALKSGKDEDIIDCDISCEGAKANIERFKEKLKGGKTKGNKKVSAAERMKYLANARKAIKHKNFAMAKDDLMKLKKLLQEQLEDPDLDPETRALIEEMLAKVDMALADIEHAEESGLLSELADMNNHLGELLGNDLSDQAKAKTRARGIAAKARAGKKGNLSNLIKGSRDLANKMKGLKFNIKEEAHKDMDQLSDEARKALELEDMLDDLANGVDALDSMLETMVVEEPEPVVEEPKNRLEKEITQVATQIREAAKDTPAVCGDIAIHFKELAKHAANANKEGIIVEGRTISAAIGQFCKELQKAQPICKDRRTADDMARSLQTLRNLATQLKIVCSVKAACVGKGDVDGDNQLISICKNVGDNMEQGMRSLSVANSANLLKKK